MPECILIDIHHLRASPARRLAGEEFRGGQPGALRVKRIDGGVHLHPCGDAQHGQALAQGLVNIPRGAVAAREKQQRSPGLADGPGRGHGIRSRGGGMRLAQHGISKARFLQDIRAHGATVGEEADIVLIGPQLLQSGPRPLGRLRRAAQGQGPCYDIRAVAALEGHPAPQARHGVDDKTDTLPFHANPPEKGYPSALYHTVTPSPIEI